MSQLNTVSKNIVSKNIVSLVVGFVCTLAVATAFAQSDLPQWGEVCEHLSELMDAQVSEQRCTEIEHEVSEDCGDYVATAMRCILAADEQADFDACEEMCRADEAVPDIPDWDAICEHLSEVANTEITAEICTEMERVVSEDCGDKIGPALRCVLAAVDMAGIEACEEICVEDESEYSTPAPP